MNAAIEVWFVVVFTVLTVVGVYLMLGNVVRDLIRELVSSKPCAVFFSRVLLLGLVFAGAIGILETSPYLTLGKSDDEISRSFMESVWSAVDDMVATFWLMMLIMFVYILVLTILTAALNRRKA